MSDGGGFFGTWRDEAIQQGFIAEPQFGCGRSSRPEFTGERQHHTLEGFLVRSLLPLWSGPRRIHPV